MSDQDAAAAKPAENGWTKFAIELGPLLVFFGCFYGFDIYVATGAFMVAITASIYASWKLTGKVTPMLWVTAVVVLFFGGLTLFLHDERFIKMKPTLVNGIFAAVLFAGLAMGKSYLQMLMQAAFPPMHTEGWMKLTRNWAAFFVAMAILNEIIWRSFSTEFWVNFKVAGFLPLSIVFMLSQVPLILKYQIEEPEGAE